MRRKQKYSWFGFDANRGSGSSSWDGRSSCSQSSSSTASKFPDFQPCQCRAADTIHTSRYNTAFVKDFSVSRYSLRYFALILHPLLSLLLRSNLPGQRTHRAKDQGLVARTCRKDYIRASAERQFLRRIHVFASQPSRVLELLHLSMHRPILPTGFVHRRSETHIAAAKMTGEMLSMCSLLATSIIVGVVYIY